MKSYKTIFIYASVLIPLLNFSCRRRTPDLPGGSRLSSWTVENFTPSSGKPEWSTLDIAMNNQDSTRIPYTKSLERSKFSDGKSEDVTIKIAQGKYKISLNYKDSSGKLVYEVCSTIRDEIYDINSPKFEASIKICDAGSNTQVGATNITEESNVVIKPVYEPGNQGGGTTNGGNGSAPDPRASPSPGPSPVTIPTTRAGTDDTSCAIPSCQWQAATMV